MKLKLRLNELVSFVASLSLLANSLLTPFSIAYAQDVTPTPEPTPVVEETVTPTPEPTEAPVVTLAPEETATPTPTPEATIAPTPEETVIPTYAPESTPTTPAPPESSTPVINQSTSQPSVTPEQPKENGHISAVVLSDTSAASIPTDDLTVNTDGSATLQTDKADYAPTDAVLVTGAGFLAGKTYKIIISSQDDPAVTHEGEVTADSEGKIIYSYQLDGNYRPNYKVEIKDGKRLIATTAFTDGSIKYTLVVFGSGSGSGNVSNPPINCTISAGVASGTCSKQYNSGDTVTLTASANSGSSFSGWSGDCSGTGSCTVNLDADKNVTAEFNLLSSPSPTPTPTPIPTPPGAGCFVDAQGANDEPGQKDLTKMCSNKGTNLETWWDWDDIGWPGGNTGDACNLFDTDNDGNANYSLCVRVENTPATFKDRVLYSCGDDRPDRCTSPVVVSPTTSTCGAGIRNDDPFPSGDAYPQDTVGYCSIPSSDFGGLSATPIDVCSYPSAEPNSDPSDCIFYAKATGKLEVKKVLVPSTDPGLFNLQINGVTEKTDATNNDTTGEVVVDAGTNTVGEIAGTATSLTNYTSAIECKILNGTGSVIASGTNSGPLDVPVADGDDIICVINNSLKATCGDGSINQTSEECDDGTQNGQVCTPDYGNTCNYCSDTCQIETVTGAYCGDGNIDSPYESCDNDPPQACQTQNGYNGTQACSSCQWGECTPDEYCGDGIQNGPEECDGVDGVTRGHSCTNSCTLLRDTGNLQVQKIVDYGDLSDWWFSLDGGAVIQADTSGVVNFGQVTTLDDHTIIESGPFGTFYLDSISGTNCTPDLLNNSATATVSKDGTTICTFSNAVNKGSITIIKDAIPDDPQDFGFTAQGSDVSGFNLDDDGNNSNGLSSTVNFPGLFPGTYSISEVLPVPGWDLTGLSCQSDLLGFDDIFVISPTASFNLRAGENITCTFTNSRLPTLTVVKEVITDNGGTKVVSDFPLFVNGSPVTSGVTNTFVPDDYIVSETEDSSYTATINDDCDENGNVTLVYGDNKTCTITNDDITPTLTLIKDVINQYGGDGVPADWTLTATGPTGFSGNGPTVNNGASFDAGTYDLSESGPSDYTASNWVCVGGNQTDGNTVEVGLGDDVTCTITNTRDTGTLRILKNVDLNGDGDYTDQGETGATDWQWQVYGPVNQSGNTGDTAITVPTGNYILAETQKPGFHLESLSCTGGALTLFTVAVTNNTNVVCTFTNKRDMGTITVDKTTDPTGSSQAFTIKLNQGLAGDPTLIHTSTLADQDVPDTFTVPTGNYWFTENSVSGWSLTGISCIVNGDTANSVNPQADGIIISKDDTVYCTVTNTRDTGTVIVHKAIDSNGDGQYEGGDTEANNLSFTWSLDGSADMSMGDQISGVTTLEKHSISEKSAPGYEYVGWFEGEGNCNEPVSTELPKFTLGENGQTRIFTLCNKFIQLALEISKTNDKSSGVGQSDTITYTLTLKNAGNVRLENIAVSDVPAGGFTYIAGSTTVDELATADPTLSGGILSWLIPSLGAGETTTIVYKLKTPSDLVAGTYTNFATCTSELTTCNPVSSTVSRALSFGYGGNLTPQVLGAATELPATGSATWILILALALLGTGLFLHGFSIKKGIINHEKN